MNPLREFVAGPAGPYLAILAMAIATFLCRASGVVLISRVRITPRVERGLRALPGSIIIATVLPIAVQSGPAAMLAVGVAAGVMSVLRLELAALIAGIGAAALARAAGL